MRHRLAVHDCATELHGSAFRTLGDRVVCTCGTRWTLTELTFWLNITRWRWHESKHGNVWVRDKAAEKAARREQILRAREWRRG